MFKRTLSASRRCVIGLFAMAMAVTVSAQSHQEKEPPAKGIGDVTLSADLVKTGLYVISGGGGNTLMRFSASGLILVDGKLPGNYRALMSQVRKLNVRSCADSLRSQTRGKRTGCCRSRKGELTTGSQDRVLDETG
jgi:hypothetical protein